MSSEFNGLPPEQQTPELAAYYSNMPLMWRNVILILLGGVAVGVSFGIIGPLNTKRMIALGLDESIMSWLGSINSWAVSLLVMYFSWKSDRTDTRFGRRIPYLLISTPFIAFSALAIPFVNTLGIMIVLSVIGMFFNDMKASTYPLLGIDCVRRDLLARVNSINGIVGGVLGFVALRYGIALVNIHPLLPYGVAAVIIVGLTAAVVWGVREPPIRIKDNAKFRPWSTFKVAIEGDRRILLLMIGAALIYALVAVSNTWVGFYILKVINVSAVEYGKIYSWLMILGIVIGYPAGHIIDRYNGYKVVMVFWALQMIWGLSLLWLVRQPLLPYLLVFGGICNCLAGAAGMMIWKSCPPEHVGSYTSTAAFFVNFTTGTMIFLSGRLIAWSHGDYRFAYLLGMMVATIGFVLIMLHWRGAPKAQPVPQPQLPSALADPAPEEGAGPGELVPG